MTTAEVRRVTEVVVAEASGRVPVIAGSSRTAGLGHRAGRAVRDLGVAALQVTPVHYLFRPDDDAMVTHFEALARGPACRSSSTTSFHGRTSPPSCWRGS